MKGFLKNKKIILILIIGGVLVIAPTVLALETNWPNSPAGTSLTDQSKLPDLIKYLYEWGIALGGLAVFISLLIAGVQYLTSLGDPTSMKEAMSRIQSAALGLVLLLSSWLILNTINPDLVSFTTEPLNLSNINPETIDVKMPSIETKPCEQIIVYYSGGEVSLAKGACKTISLSGSSITRSEGKVDGKTSTTCRGSLEFFTSSDCSKDKIGGYPATNESMTIDQRVGSIKFFY